MMNRLTAKKEDRYFENEAFWVDAEQPSEDEIDNVYFKLAEIEDLLDKYYISSVNQLDKMLEDYMLPDEEMLASKLLKKEERKKVVQEIRDYMENHSHIVPVFSEKRNVIYKIGLIRFLDQIERGEQL